SPPRPRTAAWIVEVIGFGVPGSAKDEQDQRDEHHAGGLPRPAALPYEVQDEATESERDRSSPKQRLHVPIVRRYAAKGTTRARLSACPDRPVLRPCATALVGRELPLEVCELQLNPL